MKIYKKILVISDLHLPWANWDLVKKAKAWSKKHKPDLVICLGDITDQKIWSRWPRDIDDMAPEHEFKKASEMMKKLHKLFPNMIIIRGNHDFRILKNAVEAGVPSQMFNDIDQVFNFKGWKWVKPDEKLIINTPRGKIWFCHGDECGGTATQKSRILGMSVVQGHTHKASIVYTKNLDSHFFAAEAGCILDLSSKAAKYAERNPVGNSEGFLIVKHGVPYFLPYTKNMRV